MFTVLHRCIDESDVATRACDSRQTRFRLRCQSCWTVSAKARRSPKCRPNSRPALILPARFLKKIFGCAGCFGSPFLLVKRKTVSFALGFPYLIWNVWSEIEIDLWVIWTVVKTILQPFNCNIIWLFWYIISSCQMENFSFPFVLFFF